jgi:hypothetical protein
MLVLTRATWHHIPEDGILHSHAIKTSDHTYFFHIFRNGIENISVVFTKPEKRSSWEESFNETKQKLGEYAVHL